MNDTNDPYEDDEAQEDQGTSAHNDSMPPQSNDDANKNAGAESPSPTESTDPDMPAFSEDASSNEPDDDDDSDDEKTAAMSLEELGIIPPSTESQDEANPDDPPNPYEESLDDDRTQMNVQVDPKLGAKQGPHNESSVDVDPTLARPQPQSQEDGAMGPTPTPPGPPPLPMDVDLESIDLSIERPKGSQTTSTSSNARPPSMKAMNSTLASSPMRRREKLEVSPPEAPVVKPAVHRKKEESFSGIDAAEGRTMMFDAAVLHAAASAEPQGVLTTMEGPDQGKEFFLRAASTLVGRSLECDLVINDSSVSRKHFRIDRRDGQHIIVDLGSGNGTRVDGERVTKCALQERAHIHIGTTVLQFDLVGSQQRGGIEQPASKTMGPLLFWSMGIFLLISLVFVVGLVGDHFQWWQSDESQRRAIKTKSVATSGPDIDEIQMFLAEKDLNGAANALRDARKRYGNTNELNELSAQLRDAKSHYETIQRHRKALSKNDKSRTDCQAIIRSLEVIPTDSPFYEDATMLTESAYDTIVESLKDEAYKLETQGLYAESLAKEERVLTFRPDDSEATYHRDQLNKKLEDQEKGSDRSQSDDGKEGNASREDATVKPRDKPAKVAAKKSNKTTRKEKPRRTKKERKVAPPKVVRVTPPTPPPVGRKMAQMGVGHSLYRKGLFQAAASHFDKIGQDAGIVQKDRRRAKKIATNIRAFADKYTNGQQAAGNDRFSNAITLLNRALVLDGRVSKPGHYGSKIRSKLADMYASQAQRSWNNENYAQAARQANKALKYNKNQPVAKVIRKKTQAQGDNLLARARDAKNRGNYGAAKKILRSIITTAGKKSSNGKEASRLLQEILMDEAAEEDD